MDGNIVIDDVLASCYPSAHHDLAHIGMTPMRWFPKIFKWIRGDENGILGFVLMVEELEMWVTPTEPVFGNQWSKSPSKICGGGKLNNAKMHIKFERREQYVLMKFENKKKHFF